MKISIVTPVYNTASTLEKTIQSVINQSRISELEYIIVDGGSTDGSIEIIERYLDKISVFISEKDKGVYDAMNKGISLATGDVIGIINADDWYNEGALQSIENIFIQQPDTSIVYSPIDNYVDSKYVNTFYPGSLDNLIFKFILNHPSCFIRKSIYEQIGLFNLSYKIAADYDLIFRAYISGAKFQFIDTPLASYSLNGMTGNLSNKFKLIQESKNVASDFVNESSKITAFKHQIFYLKWFSRELITLPIKLVDPFIVIKLKAIWRQKIGKLSADQFGGW
ncbi:MAG: glycosyltransferase [Scytonematopsis contorta HA4267-MV1]|jgi:glycosyltransferase involved in cell wall biosynthesis|nr:glycosyltransferase [Scytonematopsis contorta HA4267-MV1]